jgi:signal transduction histidine kinase
LNLLLNALDAMACVDDRVRLAVLRTEAVAGGVRLSVRDTGVGIQPQRMARLFEAFYTTKREGIGIGLFVCQSIIERHAGQLTVSPNDGPGVTFSFVVPSRVES